MKGLLIKDFRLLAGQKQYFLTLFLISVIFLFTGQHASFVITYMTTLCGYFTLSTVSYDEYNNGYAFLFTLPVSRKGYALEKYLFGLLVSCIGWSVTMCVTIVCQMAKNFLDVEELVAGAFAALLLPGLLIAWMLPLQLKFGAEKSRMFSLIFMVVTFALLALAARVVLPHWDARWTEALGTGGWAAAGAAVCVIMLFVSILVSIRIMERKQF